MDMFGIGTTTSAAASHHHQHQLLQMAAVSACTSNNKLFTSTSSAAAADSGHLPPGFRFHPTDEELITHYLVRKVLDSAFASRAIAEIDLNKSEPWELPARAKMGEKEWYFFCLRDRKYPTGLRTNRATESGYWKATGKDREIVAAAPSGNGSKITCISSAVGGCALVGMKKTLVFYRGRAPKGEKTTWVMHEYRLEGMLAYQFLSRSSKDEWVICRVFQKTHGSIGPGGAGGGGGKKTTSSSSGHQRIGALSAFLSFAEPGSPSSAASAQLPPPPLFEPSPSPPSYAAPLAAAPDKDENCSSFGTGPPVSAAKDGVQLPQHSYQHVPCFSSSLAAPAAAGSGGFDLYQYHHPVAPPANGTGNGGSLGSAFLSLKALQENLQHQQLLPFLPSAFASLPMGFGGASVASAAAAGGTLQQQEGVHPHNSGSVGAATTTASCYGAFNWLASGADAKVGVKLAQPGGAATELDCLWSF